MIQAICSGGQTGADRGALDAARAAGVPIYGWCPKSGWAEDMPEPPGLLDAYPELKETPSADVVQRTEWNVRDSDVTLIICPNGMENSPGTQATIDFTQKYNRAHLVVSNSNEETVMRICSWLRTLDKNIRLNVAGPRASECTDAYACSFSLVESILREASRPRGGIANSRAQAPADMLFQKMDLPCTFETMAPSTYSPVLSIDERNSLVKLAERLTGTRFFNGGCVRLERVDANGSSLNIALSTVEFFDFVAINTILANVDKALECAMPDERLAVERIAALRSRLSGSATFADALAIAGLPNVLALSCLIRDREGRCLLVRRKKSGIGAGQTSCSATGTLEEGDLAYPNPIFACAQRECREELGLAPPRDAMQFLGFVFGARKMQPAALVDVLVDDMNAVVQGISKATDFEKENAGFAVCAPAQALERAEELALTGVARMHLRLAAGQ